ncbi:MAG: HAD hydrolase family protein, partial [Oscillospiraceae bacterium]
INISDTYAFGDGDNDYDMLKFVGTGIAMGNHTERLNDIVEMITDTVQNEGIYKGLKKLQLI